MVVLDVPAETYTWTPHRSAGKFLIGTIVIARSCSPVIKFFILGRSIKEQRYLHTKTIGELEVIGSIPLILYIEAQLTCTE